MARGQAGVGEAYCTECGEVINEKAEICPECGVRQQFSGTPQSPQSRSTSTQTTTEQGDYGILFAHVDANRRKKILRNLFDLGLVFVSVGIYLGVMIGEGLRHYYRLNRGKVEPYDPNVHEKVWIV